MPIQGNHDTSPNHNWSLHFNTDRGFSHTDMPGTVYSAVVGPVLFLAINYEDYGTAGYLDQLATWLRDEVNKVKTNSAVKWRIATFHKTMFTGSQSHQSDADGRTVREALMPVFRELGINIALQGHDHIYEVLGPIGLTDANAPELKTGSVEQREQVEGGKRENMTGELGGRYHTGDATLFFLNNSAGKKKYEPRDEAAMSAALSATGVDNYWGLFTGRFGQTGEPTSSRVHVADDLITFATYTVDDEGQATLFDQFSVDRAEGSTTLRSVAATDSEGLQVSADGRTVACPGARVCIYDATGRQVAQATDQASVGGPAGLYIVQATLPNGRQLTTTLRVR